jgi:hypothetical protein
MSASADENTRSELLDGVGADPGETAAYVLWPADPQREHETDRLRIDLDDTATEPGSPVTAEARVTMPGQEEIRAVFRVQGLEPSWCPPPQVVIVTPGAMARLYVRLTPAAGTPPGRYLWSLTAEVVDRPMLAATAELRVTRPNPPPPPPPRSRWHRLRPVAVAAPLAALVAVVALALTTSPRVPWRRPSPTRPLPVPSSMLRNHHPVPTTRPGGTASSPSPTTATDLVWVQGTVLAEEGKAPIRITVVRLGIDDLNGVRPTSSAVVPTIPVVGEAEHGKHWSLSLAPGVYGLTFSKHGYHSESIVLSTAVASIVHPPEVRLVRLAPSPTATSGT